MRVYLTMGRDGRILVQARIEQSGIVGDLIKYVSQGDQFNGVTFDQLAQATPGPFDLPEQPDASNVQPDTSVLEPQPQEPQQPQQAQ
jgi:hypothetical protein